MADTIEKTNQLGTTDSGHNRVRDLSEVPELPGETSEDTGFIGGTDWSQMAGREDGQTVDEHKNAVRGTLSKKGTAYDPLLHSYPPNMTQAGEWKKRRNVKPRDGSQQSEGDSNADYRKHAQQAAFMFGHLNHIALGEGAEIREGELLPVVDAFEQMYMERGITAMPWWSNMVISLGGYTYTVASRPTPRKRVSAWFKGLMVYFGFGGDNARDDSRQQQHGKDESSEVVRKLDQ